MQTNKKQEDVSQSSNKNGIVTVNDGNNPSQEKRDEMIGKESDTDRLRSERESVQEANGNKSSQGNK